MTSTVSEGERAVIESSYRETICCGMALYLDFILDLILYLGITDLEMSNSTIPVGRSQCDDDSYLPPSLR